MKKNPACNIKLPNVAMPPAATLACHLLSRCSRSCWWWPCVLYRHEDDLARWWPCVLYRHEDDLARLGKLLKQGLRVV